MRDKDLGFIYKIYNDVNDKVYIGQTKRTIEQRWSEHKHAALKEPVYHGYLYNSMRKYGINQFHIIEIEQCEDELLNEREKYWIEYYNSVENGYNATYGGESAPETRSKPVDQIDVNTGQVIKTYKNAREIEKELGISNQYISNACNYKNNIVKGFKWQFHNEKDKIEAHERFLKRQNNRKKYKGVNVYCNELDKSFDSIKEAAIFMKNFLQLTNTKEHTVYTSICRSIEKGIKSYGYTWKKLS